MSSFKSFAPRITGLLVTAAAITACGQIGVFLVAGLMFLLIALIIVLAITGVFGSDRHKQAAQTVLAILLGGAGLRTRTLVPRYTFRPSGLTLR
jgi:hypothetical protein